MRGLRLFGDFLFGALVLGGGPLCALAVTVVVADLYQALFNLVIPEVMSLILVVLSLVMAVLVFAYAFRFRLRHRLLPKVVIVGEVLLGGIGALCVYTFYGVVTYSRIG